MESDTTIPGDKLHEPIKTPAGNRESTSVFTVAVIPVNGIISNPPLSHSGNAPMCAVGLLTCYDIRFPEVAQILRTRGAEMLAYPSAFTVRTGAAHWEVLLRSRAIETQTYVIGAAAVGQHTQTRVSWGHAMVGGFHCFYARHSG